ncbi:MAG TPA: hypothetical protein VFK30_00520 [Anaerolineae bacterium]|nr:hypothetical protein [Anaerolineae bacterium]
MNSQAVLQLLQSKVGSADWSKWQIHRWQFWDYVRYVNGTTQITLFTNPTGSSDPNSGLQKTLEETNMPSTGQFGQVYFIANQIRCAVEVLPKVRQSAAIQADTGFVAGALGDAASAINNLFRRGVLIWQIGQKEYQRIERPFLTAPPAYGVRIQQTATNRKTPMILPRQSYKGRDAYALNPAQMVEPNQTFTLTINFDSAAPTIQVTPANSVLQTLAVNVGVIFDGYLARPAQ